MSPVFLLIRRSLRQHAVSTAVTVGSMALAAGLLMTVWVLKMETQGAFTGFTGGFDGVLGARGSKLQLVLNTVFHLEESPGNLPFSDYLEVSRNPNVDLAIPLALGDSHRGFRVVGTVPELFSRAEYLPGRHFRIGAGGRSFDPSLREAVAGSFAAERLGLRVGDRFQPSHGLGEAGTVHEEEYVVVGILEPSNTPADRVLWIPLEGVQRMGGHDPRSVEDISGVLVRFKPGLAKAGFLLDAAYNKQGTRLTFAWPLGRVVAQLFDRIGWFDRVLALVAALLAVVAAGTLLTALYNSMNERRREIAILRALGAGRRLVTGVVLAECAVISALGALAGFPVHILLLGVASGIIRREVGLVIHPFALHGVMLVVPLAMIGLGLLAGAWPAWKAYRTDVAENLVPPS